MTRASLWMKTMSGLWIVGNAGQPFWHPGMPHEPVRAACGAYLMRIVNEGMSKCVQGARAGAMDAALAIKYTNKYSGIKIEAGGAVKKSNAKCGPTLQMCRHATRMSMSSAVEME